MKRSVVVALLWMVFLGIYLAAREQPEKVEAFLKIFNEGMFGMKIVNIQRIMGLVVALFPMVWLIENAMTRRENQKLKRLSKQREQEASAAQAVLGAAEEVSKKLRAAAQQLGDQSLGKMIGILEKQAQGLVQQISPLHIDLKTRDQLEDQLKALTTLLMERANDLEIVKEEREPVLKKYQPVVTELNRLNEELKQLEAQKPASEIKQAEELATNLTERLIKMAGLSARVDLLRKTLNIPEASEPQNGQVQAKPQVAAT